MERHEFPELTIDRLVQISFAVTAFLSQVAAAHDLSLTQMRMLAILRDRRPRMAELADLLGLDRSSVTGLVDRAASRGLVERRADEEDGRSVHVVLTRAGQRQVAAMHGDVDGLLAPMLQGLTAAGHRRLGTLLDQLLDGAGRS